MMLVGIFFVLLGSAWTQEVCDMIGNFEPIFQHSTLEDPQQWFGNYKGYGIFQAANYGVVRSKKTFYNTAGRPRVVIQQQRAVYPPFEQQEQIESNAIPDAVTEEPETTTTPTPPPLPIWKLQVSRNVKSLTARQVNGDGKTVPAFTLSEDDLTDANNATEYNDGYFKTIDVTDSAIETKGLYLICAVLSVSVNGEVKECRKCNLARACTVQYTCSNDLVRNTVELSRYSSESQTVMQHSIGRLPGSDAVLTTKVFFNPESRRCARELFVKEIQSIATPLQSNTLALVTVPGLLKRKGYKIETRLSITVDGEKIDSFVNEYDVSACQSTGKNSNFVNIPDDDKFE